MEEEKKKRGRPKKGEVREKQEVVLRKYREPAPKRTNAPGAGPPKKSEEEKAFTKKTRGIRDRNRNLQRRINEAKKLLKRVGEVPEGHEKVEDILVDNYVLFVEPNLDWIEDCYRNDIHENVIYNTLGIPEQTWYSYLRKYPELKELKRKNKSVALAQLENKTFKRATGVTVKQQQAIKVTEKIFNEETGKLISSIERVQIVDLNQELPPDGHLGFKLLEKWRRKQYASIENSETTENKIDKLFNFVQGDIAPNTLIGDEEDE